MAVEVPTQGTRRHVIGPIPPRDEKGRLRIEPIWDMQVKLNKIGEPVRDKEGNAVEERVDVRSKLDYMNYEQGIEHQMVEGATKGLHLYQVDYDVEASMKVWARSPEEAVAIYKREANIIRCKESDPVAKRIG